MLKKVLLILTLALLTYLPVSGQQLDKNERLKAYKVAFFTNQIGLSPEEAASFWPVYNDYEEQKNALKRQTRVNIRNKWNNLDNMSEEEVQKLLDETVKIREKEWELFEDYHKRFQQILPPHKVAKLYKAEVLFKKQLARKLQEKAQARPQRR